MKILLLLSVLMVISCLAFAAVTGLQFGYSTGTYTEITGGTLLTTVLNSDDAVYNNKAIPFTFTYNGTGYTAISVCDNGFMAMGTTVSSSYVAISGGSTNNVIVPLGADLRGNTSGSIRYETIGTAPNRIVVVQWKNYKNYYGANTDSYNFQVKLYENGNKVEFCYGSFTGAYSASYQVGLRGSSSADYNNRTTTTDWAATTGGAVNSATCSLSSTIYPANGATFAWTIPAIGVLNVNPNPIAFGTAYVGIGMVKQQLVSLSNSGGADFTINSGGITLAGHADFTLGAVSLPVTLTPGGAPLTFYVYYTPTELGAQSATLTINDTRATSNVAVTGTGATPLEGDICEYPYNITSNPTSYSANTVGYANDYTYAMFTGMTSTSYITGLDWVAKLVLPSEKSVNISVADQTGYSYQYLGVYLVGSIPSLASPAAVLGQATASTGTVTIPTLTLPAGTYYIIVDNWPSPINIYFTLNVSYSDPAPPLPATLVSPTPSGVTGVLRTATLNWANGGGGPTGYKLQYGITPDANDIMPLTNIGNVITYDPPGLFDYSQTYYWKVVPFNGAGDAVFADCPVWSFTVQPDPTQPVPYSQNFDSGTTLAGINWTGTMYIATTGGNPTNRLTYNLYSSAPACNAVTCPIGPLPAATQLLFDYRLMNWSGYPTGGAAVIGAGDNIQVQVSTDGGVTWSPSIYTINSTNHTTSTSYVTLTIPVTGYAGTSALFRFLGTWGTGDYYVDIDNVVVRQTPAGPPLPPTLTYPVALTGLPKTGFNLTWAPNPASGPTNWYNVYFWTDEQSLGDGPQWSTTGTSLDPTNPPLDPLGNPQTPIVYNYLDRYNWTVEAYANAYPGQMAWPEGSWFSIMADPSITLPHTQNFDAATMPAGWTQSFSGGVTSNRWTISNTANAGGAAYEAMNTWVSGVGISRLISPPINTTGVSAFQAIFKHMFDDYGAGITAKLQYSHDLSTWYDTAWSVVSGGGNVSGDVSVLVSGISQPMTYVAWTMDGNHYQYDYWYVDNVLLQQPALNEVAPVSINMPQVVHPQLLTPQATVINNGILTQTFDVNMTIGAYSSTQQVVGLTAGQTQVVNFTPFTPTVWTANNVVVTTLLAGDQIPGNDVLNGVLVCLDLNVQGYADVAYDPGAVNDGPATFNFQNPGAISDLPAANPFAQFLAGADWMNGGWYGTEYVASGGSPYWSIDPVTGAGTVLGTAGVSMSGFAYDDGNNIMYATSGTALYTMNASGASTLIGNLHLTGETTWAGLMIGIAYDSFYDVMYGVDLGYDWLFEIDPADGLCTPIGPLGVGLNYAQDCALDRETGLLWLAGYTSSGALYWIDTVGGGAYKVGDFQNGSELTGFAIPYSAGGLDAPVVSIAADGTVSWAAVAGATSYKVYGSADPYGAFTFLGTTASTSWLDPSFPSAMKFYYVTANSATRAAVRPQVQGLRNLAPRTRSMNLRPAEGGVVPRK